MIDSIDEALRRLLQEEIPKSLHIGPKQGFRITFEAPTKTESTSADLRLNLYLHDVTENTKFRLEPFTVQRQPTEKTATRKRSKVRVDLSYLVTAHGPDGSAEHQLLTAALAGLLRNPVIPKRYLEGSEYETEASMAVAQPRADDLSHKPADLWLAMGAQLRPSLALTVTADFDPFETHLVRVVRELVLGLGFVTEGGEVGRPGLVKSHRVSAAGLVLTEERTPLVGASVSVVGRPEIGVSNDRGFFFIANLPPGPHRLTVHLRGYASSEQRVEAPPSGLVNEIEPLIVTLVRLDDKADAAAEAALFKSPPGVAVHDRDRQYPPAVTGKLMLSDGRPAAFVPVRLGDQRSVTDEEGRYRFRSWVSGGSVWATVPGVGETEVKVSGGAGKVPKMPVEPTGTAI